MPTNRRNKTKTRSANTLAKLPPINKKASKRILEFFPEVLRHSKGQLAGSPFELLPWQKTVLNELFGRLKPDGSRLRRVGYIEVPKKQGKSTLLAGVALYMLLADGEQGAEIYGAASDREQASIIYRECASMVRNSPWLSQYCEVIDSRKTIFVKSTNSFYRVLAADSFRAEGLNIHALLFDELHAQRSRALWDALRYGGAARRQPLVVSITTAGSDRSSICWEQHQYAERVIADPLLDPAFYGCIYKADEDADITKPATWKKANPSLGHTITKDSFETDAREAVNSPAKLNSFKRYRLNIWTTQTTAFFNPNKWLSCSDEPQPLEGRRVFAGLDLSTTTDLTALCLIAQDDDGALDVLPFFWCCEESIDKRSNSDRVDYRTWADQGLIKVTDGSSIDYKTIETDVLELCDRYKFELGTDPWNSTMLAQNLAAQGMTICNVRQGFGSLSEPTKRLEALVLNGKLRHGGHRLLEFCANNTAVQMDHAGNIKPSKAKSTERIDGIAALITAMAVQSAAATPTPDTDWNIIQI